MIKVLYLLPAEKFGGAERQGIVAIKRLAHFDVEVHALVGPGNMITDALDREGVKNYTHTDSFPDDPKHPLTFTEKIHRGIYNYNCFKKSKLFILDILKTKPADLIYATRTFSWIVAGFIGRQTDIPVIWRCGSIFTSELQRVLTRHFMDWSKPVAIVSNSKAMSSSFGDGLEIPSYIIPSSVDLGRFHSGVNGSLFKEKYDLRSDIKYIGIAARPAPEKGPLFLVEIAKELREVNPKTRILWAGESSWRPHLEAIFKEASLEDYFRFLGHVPDIENFYAACDAVILASKPKSIESSPNALLEPMAMGKPIIATEAGGIPEIIDDGENGFIRNYGDSRGFASAILKTIGNQDLALRLGTNARKYIETNHSVEINIQNLADVFKRHAK